MKALIFGIRGQTGSYLEDLLLDKGYDVFGFSSVYSSDKRVFYGDLRDLPSVHYAINECRPDEIYNLAAITTIKQSILEPIKAVDVNGNGLIRIIQSVKHVNPEIKIFQAGSSEMFGQTETSPQNEQTPFNPQTPYAWGKHVAHLACEYYRNEGFYICEGILYPHESPRRREEYVTRKISLAVAQLKLGTAKTFDLEGNLDALRDWSYAGDVVMGIHLMMQQPKSDMYVLGSGEQHSVKEFLDHALTYSGIYVPVSGKESNRSSDSNNWCADITKIKSIGYKPSVVFEDLVKLMVDVDTAREYAKINW